MVKFQHNLSCLTHAQIQHVNYHNSWPAGSECDVQSIHPLLRELKLPLALQVHCTVLAHANANCETNIRISGIVATGHSQAIITSLKQ